jgi:hypothetical protein
VVVLPTPPDPQHTMILVRLSSMILSMSRRGLPAAGIGPVVLADAVVTLPPVP